MSSMYYDSNYMFSNYFNTKSNLVEVFANYNNIPMFVIRFAMLIYQEKSEEAIMKLIMKDSRGCENLMDCIITSSNVKLCDVPLMKVLCQYKCICTMDIDYSNIFNKMLSVLKNNFNMINSQVFSINFADLIKNTNVYNNKMGLLIKEIVYKNSKYHNAVLELIANSELYNESYYKLIEYIEDNTKHRVEIYKCCELKDIITKHLKQCSYIKNNVYISNFKFADNVVSIKDKDFKYIVTVCKKNLVKTDIKNYIISIPDTDEKNFIDESKDTLKLLRNVKGKKILCHCNMGISRSVVFTALLFYVRNKIDFDKGLKLIKKNRPIANPNPKILKQVKKDIGKLRDILSS